MPGKGNKLYALMACMGLLITLITRHGLHRDLEDMRWRSTVLSLTVNDTFGRPVKLESFSGQVLLIVNIASRCGLTTSQYTGLHRLREKYEAEGLSILNFPCNQFGSQMPESDGQDMLNHLHKRGANIGHVFAKIEVKGTHAHPLYQLLTRQGGQIEWNFVKFLIDRKEGVFQRYDAETEPADLANDIERLLLLK
ncbi:hypothetical protein KR018_011724 [Drosophila ironensis]|nr:hypothetical protein KR018_011724 [Drosophila ironensis]